MKLFFKVTSSSKDEIYELVAGDTGSSVYFTCTCSAGINGAACKHRLSLIDGDASNLASKNESDIKTLQTMIAGSKIEAARMELLKLEKELQILTKLTQKARKKVGHAMSG